MTNFKSLGGREDVETMAAFGEMARELLHEINSPLTSMQLHVEMIKRAVKDTPVNVPVISANADSLERNLFRITHLQEAIRDRYTIARALKKERTNLLNSIDEALAQCQHHISSNGIKLQVAVPPDIHIYHRPIELSEVWLNLIQNAVDAIVAQNERWIRIEADAISDHMHVIVFVTDSGRDLHPTIKQKMFKESFSSKPTGSGLGLNIVKRILEAYGGSIQVSENSAHTQFKIVLFKS